MQGLLKVHGGQFLEYAAHEQRQFSGRESPRRGQGRQAAPEADQDSTQTRARSGQGRQARAQASREGDEQCEDAVEAARNRREVDIKLASKAGDSTKEAARRCELQTVSCGEEVETATCRLKARAQEDSCGADGATRGRPRRQARTSAPAPESPGGQRKADCKKANVADQAGRGRSQEVAAAETASGGGSSPDATHPGRATQLGQRGISDADADT
jgi:hypothetical protein